MKSTKSIKVNTEETPATAKAATVAHDAIDAAAVKAAEVERSVRTQASRGKDRLEQTQEATTRRFDESIADLEAYVKERPVAATGMAFAAGAVLTALLRR